MPSPECPCNLQDAEGILVWQQVHSVRVAGLDMCLVFLPERADSHPVALGSTPEQSRYLLQEDFGEQRCTRMRLSLLDAGELMPVRHPALPECYSSTASHHRNCEGFEGSLYQPAWGFVMEGSFRICPFIER